MRTIKYLTLSLFLQFIMVFAAQAGDFAWMDSLRIEARSDGSGLKARIATRFHIGDAKVTAVIGDVGSHADAYMAFRLAEMSHQPIDRVVRVYQANRDRGWGVIAQRLGIKPGSREFHALKRGHDLGGGRSSGGKFKDSGKGKGKGNQGNGKGKGKNK